ncbi:peroxisomal biogenesis factor 2-like [Rhodamnia argentea]|uniref:Peroxisomal biogenesis factor 2-like n=1 Tax=Rhodamnia argentea TaxID=178133 RepID=A0ABM3HXZ1_9MYRT|nr:peroxisomal biogenesis factor 2-like [Rhodamnia argentea]
MDRRHEEFMELRRQRRNQLAREAYARRKAERQTKVNRPMLAPWEKGKRPAIKTKPKHIVLKKPKLKMAKESPEATMTWTKEWSEELRQHGESIEGRKTIIYAFSREDSEIEPLEEEPIEEEVLIEDPYPEEELSEGSLEEEPPMDYSSEEVPTEESTQDNEDYPDEESDEDN